MSNERTRNLVVRLADAELEMAHALAADEGEPVSVLIRRMIRQRHVARFGDSVVARPEAGPRRRRRGAA